MSLPSPDPANPYSPPTEPIRESDPDEMAVEGWEPSREDCRAERFLRALSMGNLIGATLSGLTTLYYFWFLSDPAPTGLSTHVRSALHIGGLLFLPVGAAVQLIVAKGLRERKIWARRAQFGLSVGFVLLFLATRILAGTQPARVQDAEARNFSMVIGYLYMVIHGYAAYRVSTRACARVISPDYIQAREASHTPRARLGLGGWFTAIPFGLVSSFGFTIVAISAAAFLVRWLSPFTGS